MGMAVKRGPRNEGNKVRLAGKLRKRCYILIRKYLYACL